jgi:hypothetical protein
MKIYGINIDGVQKAARAAHAVLKDPELGGTRKVFINTTIRPDAEDKTFRKHAPSTGHKINAVDELGHGAFIIALFEQNPNAVITAGGGKIKYDGLASFAKQLDGFINQNIGSHYSPKKAYDNATETSRQEWENVWVPRLKALCEANGVTY